MKGKNSRDWFKGQQFKIESEYAEVVAVLYNMEVNVGPNQEEMFYSMGESVCLPGYYLIIFYIFIKYLKSQV